MDCDLQEKALLKQYRKHFWSLFLMFTKDLLFNSSGSLMYFPPLRDEYIYIITTVTWSEETDHVKLTGADHQIAWDAKRRVWSDDLRLSTRRDPTLRI
jgi:hypothetical protein